MFSSLSSLRRHLSRAAVATGSAVALSATLLASAAQAQNNQGVQFWNAKGTVACQIITVDSVRSALCISNTKGARADRPSCNPPNELVPSVRYNAGGRAHEGCWNQGLVDAKHHLSGGQVRFTDGYMVVSDFNGGLDVFDVQNSRHVARVDGTQASAGNAFGIPGSL